MLEKDWDAPKAIFCAFKGIQCLGKTGMRLRILVYKTAPSSESQPESR